MNETIQLFYKTLAENPLPEYKQDIPQNMKIKSVSEIGKKYHWLPVRVGGWTENALSIFENCLTRYPLAYIEWFTSFHTLDLNLDHLRINGNLPKDGFEKLYALANPDLQRLNLSAFGFHDMSLHTLVFDYNHTIIANEPTIKLFRNKNDHHEAELQNDIVFSSFEAMLNCWIHFLKHLPTTGITQIIPEFYKIDPNCEKFWSSEKTEHEECEELFDFS